MTPPDFKQIILMSRKTSNLRDKILIRIIYQTGCTPKEASLIKIQDIDVKNSFIRIKGKKDRISQISEELAKDIAVLIVSEKPSTYLFASKDSASISAKRITQIIETAGKNAVGMAITPAQIRQTAIIDALKFKIPLTEIQKQTGLDSEDILEIAGKH